MRMVVTCSPVVLVYLQELQKSIQVSVLKTADAVAQLVREGGGGQVQFHPDVVAQVSALIWDTVSDDWTSDLLAFSSHGGRQTVNVSDVALIMRRNKHLLEIVSKAADIDLGDYERPVTKRQRSSNKESARGRRGARSGTSRPSTAMDAPALHSGVLTPHSDQDRNSRSSIFEEVKEEAELEQKATTATKAVPQLEIVSKAADIDLGDYERPVTKRQRSSNKESARGRRGARSGTSRPSTAMDAPALRSGVLTPHSDQDRNSRSSAIEEVKEEADLEQKATTATKAVPQEDFDDDDVMIVDASPKQLPLPGKGKDFDDDDFSMLDLEPAPATVSKHPVQASTPVSLDLLSRRTSQSLNETPRRSARNALRATVGQESKFSAESSTSRKNPQNSSVAKTVRDSDYQLQLENGKSPTEAKSCPRKKTPSPDLFNTPVKENNSDEFDDLFEIPEKQQDCKGQHRQSSPRSKSSDVGAAPGKSEGGWSVKFSEFSFFDDDLEVDQHTAEKGKAVQQPLSLEKPSTSAASNRSKDMTPSATPKSSLVPKSKLTRSGIKSAKQQNSAAALRSQEKQPLTTPKRTDVLKSKLKDSAKKVSRPPTKPLDDFDSDEDFFDL
ncbi:hypothetical protein ANCCAN_17660 [Ancylostoma caninum]|uniref:Centromere protein S n=1 Tax=Ancylostoma caninum TaxID=29170 RepID=A0A368G0A9_ANCCA|nr:hypothetical protein ANCCAN_17660 [Ancylostoma caninum]